MPYCLFDTSIGRCGIAWEGETIVRLQLPEQSEADARRRLQAFPEAADIPAWIDAAVMAVRRHLVTGREDLARLPVDFAASPTFHRLVFAAAMRVRAGETTTYGELARLIGSPGAARAVGQAMGANPLPLIVPCHRVLAANEKPGGFSAWGGLHTKRRLLALESGQRMLSTMGGF